MRIMLCVVGMLFLVSSNAFGENVKACTDTFVKIQGSSIAVVEKPQKRERTYSTPEVGKEVEVTIVQEEKKQQHKQQPQTPMPQVQLQKKENGGYLTVLSSSPGVFTFTVLFSYKTGENKQTISVVCAKKISTTVYTKSIMYRQKNEKSIDRKLQENISNRQILFTVEKIEEGKKQKMQEILNVSELLFIDMQDHKDVFSLLQQREQKIDLKSKKIFLVTQKDKELEKKGLMPLINGTAKKSSIYLISTKEFESYLIGIALGKTEAESELLENAMLLTRNPGGKGINKILNILVYYGISKEILGALLMIPVAVCLLIFCKHVIGFPCYGLYYPIIGAIGIIGMGIPASIILLASCILSYLIVRFVGKKVMLLVYGKMGLYIFLSLLIFLGMQSIFFSYEILLLPKQTLEASWGFGVFLFIVSVRKVFGETTKPGRLKWWMHVVRFSILSYGISKILTNTAYQEVFLLYPYAIGIILLLIFLLGTYSQLQLVEVFRFWRLIRKKLYKLKM